LCQALTAVSVQHLLESSVRYLLDPRLVSSSEGEGLSEIQNSLSKGLSAIVLKLSRNNTVPPGVMMCAIIETLLLCIPEKNHSVDSLSRIFSLPPPTLQRSLSVKCIRPLSRLLLQLMSNERSRGEGSAYRSPNVDAMRLVAVLNTFFNSHPASSPSETTPYSCAKTLLSQLIDCLGIDAVTKIMKALKISSESFLSRFLPPSLLLPSSVSC
jgi:hypothetical protein